MKQQDTAAAMLTELRAAHQIIQNALNVMTFDQKLRWGELNFRDGVGGEGITRANEREEIFTKADGSER